MLVSTSIRSLYVRVEISGIRLKTPVSAALKKKKKKKKKKDYDS